MVGVKGIEEEGGIGAGVWGKVNSVRGRWVTPCPTEVPTQGTEMDTHLPVGRTVNRSA